MEPVVHKILDSTEWRGLWNLLTLLKSRGLEGCGVVGPRSSWGSPFLPSFPPPFSGRKVTDTCSGRKRRPYQSPARMSRGLGIGWPHLPERGGVATCSNMQVPRPPPRGASLPGHLAFVCDAWHMLGSHKRIKHRSRERLQKESPQAAARYLGCWLKMQELGLHLRPVELVPGERPGSPCSNQPPV